MGILRFLNNCSCKVARKGSEKSFISQMNLSNTVLETPDLSIYSQMQELVNGRIPSWDNPDIITNDWAPFRLKKEAEIIIRNTSKTVPAINALIHYFVSPFGIGTIKEHKLSKVVNILANQEVKLLFPLDSQTLQGDPRIGVHIEIEHSTDNNKINNFGSQIHDGGYTSESGRNFSLDIPIFNNSNYSREIRLEILQTDIIASISFSNVRLSPNEQKIATLDIKIPDYLKGTRGSFIQKQVTLIGKNFNGDLLGGVTRLIRIDN